MAGVVPEGTTFKDMERNITRFHVENAFQYLATPGIGIETDEKTTRTGEGILYAYERGKPEGRAILNEGKAFGTIEVVRVAYLYFLGVKPSPKFSQDALKDVNRILYGKANWTSDDSERLLTKLGYKDFENFSAKGKSSNGGEGVTLEEINKYVKEALYYMSSDYELLKGTGKIKKGEKNGVLYRTNEAKRVAILYEGKMFMRKDVVRIAYYLFHKEVPSDFLGVLPLEDIDAKIIEEWTKSLKGINSYRELLEGLEMFKNGEAKIIEIENTSQKEAKRENLNKYVKLLRQFYQIIFYGPPGTGKTYRAMKLLPMLLDVETEGKNEKQIEELLKEKQGNRWDIVQFHPSYNYEDFVRGVKVTTKENKVVYKTEDRIFGKMCKTAKDEYDLAEKEKREPKKYVLIIDEINRVNVSAVLGELIYALEYRGKEITTPYTITEEKSGENSAKLIIPKNLYIIGTMNTADRTIGQIDYAVRRRFAFEHCLPDETIITKDAEGFFRDVNGIFNNHMSPDYDAEDVRIGHSYFLASGEELANKIIYQVVPILREYVKDGVLSKDAEEKINKIKNKAEGRPDDEVENGSVNLADEEQDTSKRLRFSWEKDGRHSGTISGIGRTVLSIVQDYVESHPSITIEKLQEWFPDKGKGGNKSRGIKLAKDVNLDERPKRFFIDEKDRLYVNREIAYVTNQWGTGDTNRGTPGSFEDFREEIKKSRYIIRDAD